MMMRRFALLAAALLALMALVACGSGEPVAEPELTPGEATGLDGAVLLQEKCTVCHDLARVEAQDLDAVGWAAVIDEMITKGAQVTDDEAAALAEYLALQ